METLYVHNIQQLFKRYQMGELSSDGLLRAFQAINEAFAARYGCVYPISYWPHSGTHISFIPCNGEIDPD